MSMFTWLFRKLADNRHRDSWASRMRRKRLKLLLQLLDCVPRPIRILDVGGEENFWKTLLPELRDWQGVSVTLMNVFPQTVSTPNFTAVTGDARHMPQFADGEFDLVFSNSVIEHVGTFEDQQAMAAEVKRVGRRYLLQTPNYWFPIEPHFVFPCFQYLPIPVRTWLLQHVSLGWLPRTPDYNTARREVESIRLLTGREMKSLFPQAHLWRERLAGLTKSFVVYDGFGRSVV
jgi:hypothetical protein